MTLPHNSTLNSGEFTKCDTMSTYAGSAALVTAAATTLTRASHLESSTAAAAPTTTTSPTPTNNTVISTVGVQQTSAGTNANTIPATVFSSHELAVENVMPGIYLTKNFIAWTESSLRAHGFTHIIIIDKHIQELYYPSPVFKLSVQNGTQQSLHADDPFDYFCQPATNSTSALSFGKEFEAIDLNFGEKSYLTTVLPNCYRAVRFINKALQSGGTILVIDCNGGEQKCVTIVVAYLMFKHNISFSNAFARLKDHYNKADLDRFYTSQLYEYEPILQVQRAQLRGHSCSRDLHAAILKRKKTADDYDVTQCTNDFFVNLNPLSQFNANHTLLPSHVTQANNRQQQEHQHQQQHQQASVHRTQTTSDQKQEQQPHEKQTERKFHNQNQQQQLAVMSYHTTSTWDDYAME